MVIPEKIAEEVKAPVKFIEARNLSMSRDLAYERFKNEKFVTHDYFILSTQKLTCSE